MRRRGNSGDRVHNFTKPGNHAGCSGNGGGGNYSSGVNYSNNQAAKPTFQICIKDGHPAGKCWKRFNASYLRSDARSANMIAPCIG